MKINLKFIYCIALLFSCSFFYSQNSGVKGIVIDENTGQSIPGASLIIKETNKSQVSDQFGNFMINSIGLGKYTIIVSAKSYLSKEIRDVEIVTNDVIFLTISLTTKENVVVEKLKENKLEDVVIVSKAKLESVKSLLTMQKNNVSVSDGVSAETIKRTPDKNTSDVLKRISGASIQDNKFVIIRGLNDRYNIAYLNNAPLPSSEPDRKAFSFDIFPSNMLDNLVINKTASPDMPGEFAGGVIQINTKSVPDKNFQSLSIGAGYNTITTGKNQLAYKGSSTDWLGFDNGSRKIPSEIPSTEVFKALNYTEQAAIAKSFETDWSLYNKTFSPNTSFQYTLGKRYDIKDKTVGLLFSISHNKTNNYNLTNRYDWDDSDKSPKGKSILTSSFEDKNYSIQVLTGAIANGSIKINQNNTISLKNMYSINSTDLVVDRYGSRDLTDPRVISANVRWFTSNKIYSGQLNGDHFLPTSKFKVNWNLFYSKINRSTPNLRRNIYSIADPSSTDPQDLIPTASIASNNTGPDYGGGMFFSENKESIYGGKFDISRKINITDNFLNEIKIGGLYQTRKRDFSARQLQYNELTLGGTFKEALLNLPDSEIFKTGNMGVISSGVNGFTLNDGTKFTDAYQAGSRLNAAYVMIDNRYKIIRFVWGVRVENYIQTLNARLTNTKYLNLDTQQNDILPSANLILSIANSDDIDHTIMALLS